MTELSPFAVRLLAVLNPGSRISLRRAAHAAALRHEDAYGAYNELKRSGAIDPSPTLARTRGHELLELTDSGRAFQAQLLSQEGRAA